MTRRTLITVIKNTQTSKLKDRLPIDDDGSVGGCGATVLSRLGRDELLEALQKHHAAWLMRRERVLEAAEGRS